MTSSKSYAPFIVMLSIFSRLQLSVLKIAKIRKKISCSFSKYGSNAVLIITIDDVISKLLPIYSDVVYIFAGTALSFVISQKS